MELNTIKWAVVCFTLPMNDGDCGPESLEVDNCGHSEDFYDLTGFLIRFRFIWITLWIFHLFLVSLRATAGSYFRTYSFVYTFSTHLFLTHTSFPDLNRPHCRS